MQKRANAGHGFTLIELMIVLAIIGLLLATGVYTYRSQIREIKLRGDIRELDQKMQIARMRTMSTGMSHGIAIYTYTDEETSQTILGYMIFADCNGDDKYTDTDSDPRNNGTVSTAEECADSTDKDPIEQGDHFHVMTSDNLVTAVPGTPVNGVEYIVFNNLGQTVQGNTPISGDIVVQHMDANDNPDVEGIIRISASGLTDILPVQNLKE